MTAWEESLRTGKLQEILKAKKWKTLVDIGCGNGDLLNNIRKGYPKQKLCGLDKDINKAIETHHKGFKIYCGDACLMNEFVDETFDIVTTTGVIEHVENPWKMLKEICRILKPGGTLFLATVFKKPWAKHFYNAPCGRWALDPTHLMEYTEDKQLLPLFAEAGLRIKSQEKVRLYRRIRKLGLWIPTMGYYDWEIVAEKQVGTGTVL